MRNLFSAIFLAVALASSGLAVAQETPDTVMRLKLPSKIFFTGAGGGDDNGPPDGGPGSNNPITIVVDDAVGRIFRPIAIPVEIRGATSGSIVTLEGPAGFTWIPGETGFGTIEGSVQASQTYQIVIRVADATGTPKASDTINLVAVGSLTASVPTTSFEAEIGQSLTITPSVQNLIAGPGTALWGGSLPGWMSLNGTTGVITVDTSAANTASGVTLTAVDQTDLEPATTTPFSITVVGNEYVHTISADTLNVTMADLFTPEQWLSSKDKKVVIAEGVTVYSQNPGIPALRSGGNWNGALTVENHGNVYGAGGKGSTGVGAVGGTAISVNGPVTFLNYGNLKAGGGAGGAGGKGGDAGGWVTSGSWSALQNVYASSSNGNRATQCYKTGTTISQVWNGVNIGNVTASSPSIDRLSGAESPYRYNCTNTTSLYGTSIRRIALVFNGTASGTPGGTGGDGETFGLNTVAGQPGAVPPANAGRGGTGGNGGTFGANGNTGNTGATGNSLGESGKTGGLAGFAYEGPVTYQQMPGGVKAGR